MAQTGLGQALTQCARSSGPAGEKEHRTAPGGEHLPHRVAGQAVGGDDGPLLPGAAQLGGKILQTGDAGQHPDGNAPLPQQGEKRPGPGVKAGVPAVQHAGERKVPALQDLQHIRRLGGGEAGGLRGEGALLQQAAGAEQTVGAAQGLRCGGGEGFSPAGAHAD